MSAAAIQNRLPCSVLIPYTQSGNETRLQTNSNEKGVELLKKKNEYHFSIFNCFKSSKILRGKKFGIYIFLKQCH